MEGRNVEGHECKECSTQWPVGTVVQQQSHWATMNRILSQLMNYSSQNQIRLESRKGLEKHSPNPGPQILALAWSSELLAGIILNKSLCNGYSKRPLTQAVNGWRAIKILFKKRNQKQVSLKPWDSVGCCQCWHLSLVAESNWEKQDNSNGHHMQFRPCLWNTHSFFT